MQSTGVLWSLIYNVGKLGNVSGVIMYDFFFFKSFIYPEIPSAVPVFIGFTDDGYYVT